MTNLTSPPASVWDGIHHSYVREHVAKAQSTCESIADMLNAYADTGNAVYWKDALMLIRSLEDNMTMGSLHRIKKLAYFVCEPCDSDICDHALAYNG
jgi:hypothetical protein